MRFEFATSSKVIFGPGTLDELGSITLNLGKRALLIIGTPKEYASPLLSTFAKTNISYLTFLITSEPTIDLVQSVVDLARQENCDLLVGYGGGSAIDTAKAVSAMLTNPGSIHDYLEVVGRGQTLNNMAVPCVAIPTTAGTGAEVTRNAVLGVPEQKVKVSLRSPLILPRLAYSGN
jgi:alcohol dehydrogenase class IV